MFLLIIWAIPSQWLLSSIPDQMTVSASEFSFCLMMSVHRASVRPRLRMQQFSSLLACASFPVWNILAFNFGPGFLYQAVQCWVGDILAASVPIHHKSSCLVCFTLVAKTCNLFPSCHFYGSVSFLWDGFARSIPNPTPLSCLGTDSKPSRASLVELGGNYLKFMFLSAGGLKKKGRKKTIAVEFLSLVGHEVFCRTVALTIVQLQICKSQVHINAFVLIHYFYSNSWFTGTCMIDVAHKVKKVKVRVMR